MLYIALAVAVGAVVYIAILALQSRDQKADLEKWQDMLGIAAVASLVLVGYFMWSAFGRGPGPTLRSILEMPFEYRARRWVSYIVGYATASFAVLCAAHVVFLRFRASIAARHDP
jgi:hypothetical protein